MMSAEDLRTTLLAYAASLPSSRRRSFLDIFAKAMPSAHTGGLDFTWPVEDSPLLDDIDAFADDVRSGAFSQGYGFDSEIREYRTWGDESWVPVMDALFEAAQAAFVQGRLGLARAAYRRLFDALDLGQEPETLPGRRPAVEMVTTDVAEAQARYLRAVYETTPPEERADVLDEEWFDLPVWQLPSLRAVREALPDDLCGLDEFLPEFADRLRERRGAQVGVLLVEVVEAGSGVDGLGVLARESEFARAQRYLEWVRALIRAGRRADAEAAAREALAAAAPADDDHEERAARARIADLLADLHPATALDARLAAWQVRPSRARLLALHSAAMNEATTVMATVAKSTGDAPDHLRAVILILACQVDEAVKLLDQEASPYTSRSADRVVLPYLLAASSDATHHPRWESSQLRTLLSDIDDLDPWESLELMDDEDTDGDTPTKASLADLLIAQLRSSPAGTPRGKAYLKRAVTEVDATVDKIVGNQRRGEYAHAARLVVCYAEAVTMNDDAQAVQTYLQTARERYPRHSSYRAELDLAVRKSPLLPDPPIKARR
jgi:hypothetical protein